MLDIHTIALFLPLTQSPHIYPSVQIGGGGGGGGGGG